MIRFDGNFWSAVEIRVDVGFCGSGAGVSVCAPASPSAVISKGGGDCGGVDVRILAAFEKLGDSVVVVMILDLVAVTAI